VLKLSGREDGRLEGEMVGRESASSVGQGILVVAAQWLELCRWESRR